MEFTNKYIHQQYLESIVGRRRVTEGEKWKKCSIHVDFPYWTSAMTSFKCDASGEEGMANLVGNLLILRGNQRHY